MVSPGSPPPASGSEEPVQPARPSLITHAPETLASDDDYTQSPVLVEPDTEPSPICNPAQVAAPMTGAIGRQNNARHTPFAGLQIRTDLPMGRPVTPHESDPPPLHHSLSAASLPHRTPSRRGGRLSSTSNTDSLSPSSAMSSVISSPQLAAMADITPLPSPVGGLGSPWRSGGRRLSHSLSRTSSTLSGSGSSWNLRSSDSSGILRSSSSRSRTRQYSRRVLNDADVRKDATDGHEVRRGRGDSRSSECTPKTGVPYPEPIDTSKARQPEGGPSPSDEVSDDICLHREQYLAVQRGLAQVPARPPTPPRSTPSQDDDSEPQPIIKTIATPDGQDEFYFVKSIRSKQPRTYRKLRQLGHGTFSRVSLAVRVSDETDGNSGQHARTKSFSSQKLVAVKIIDYGPAGGAYENRIEVSLKREVDILQSVNHPSLVQLKAFGSDEKRALLVLDYCPGGDLFDFATSGGKLLTPPLIRRIFAELVAAVSYLHANYIVHRDIKLENVLVNPTAPVIEQVSDWRTYDRAVVTLSDLGLSRRIPEPPESPLLHTRCGSEDYAAPEILMGQPYDGRSTDAWALGVLLYAMMESRLPFDALPGTRGDPEKLRARTPHRIARCEWSWYRYANEDGEWDPVKGGELAGARDCVEALLKRNTRRASLDDISRMEYVADAICILDGMKRGDKEVP